MWRNRDLAENYEMDIHCHVIILCKPKIGVNTIPSGGKGSFLNYYNNFLPPCNLNS